MSNGFFSMQKNILNSGKDFNITNYFENATKSFKKNMLTKDPKVTDIEEPFVDSSTQIQLHKEVLWENTSNTRIISSSVDMIDFRYCENGKLSEPFNLTLFNNTHEKIKIKWLLNKPILTSNLTKIYNLFSLENIIFIVNPEEAIINRKSSMDFKIFFKPNCAEHYFHTKLSCLATLQTNYEYKFESTKGFEKNSNLTQKQLSNLSQPQKTFTTIGYRANLLKNLEKNEKSFEYFDPPFPLKINVIGHSFPPNTQIFMPMIELNPSKELVFQPSTLNQSVFQTISIKNKSDTPLYYKFMNDVSNVFRVFPKLGLIEPRSFNLILVEFSPKEVKPYAFPLKIIFNHDLHSMHTLLLYGLCCDPDIEIENATNDEIYFSPSFVGISTVKSVHLINKSPIKVNIQISTNSVNNNTGNFLYTSNMNFNSMKTMEYNTLINTKPEMLNTNNNLKDGEAINMDKNNNLNKPQKQSKLALINYKENLINGNNNNKNNEALNSLRKGQNDLDQNSLPNNNNIQSSLISVYPNYFEMEPNQITKLDISFSPLIIGNIESRIEICSSRIYDPFQEMHGIFNPGFGPQQQNNLNIKTDKRTFKKIIKIIGKGNDGDLKIEPALLDFGTVKVGFEKKLKFSIFNPTICNFYVKIEFENNEVNQKILKLDFKEGFINSLCKKDVYLTFSPKSRANFEIKIKLYSCENTNENISQKDQNKEVNEENKILKFEILVRANGDYPLLKICDVRNTNIGMSYLWESFNVDSANEELSKQLTEEEIYFINNEKTNNKLQDYYDKLQLIKFNFGKHLLKKSNNNSVYNRNSPNFVDIFLTLNNVGGVTSEFFFKFPHDISIKREPWMEDIQTTSNENKEYQILKSNLFDISPRQYKLEPNEYINIRFRYDIKQTGDHRLRVIFQIINGKPLVFELNAETFYERNGILEIRNRNLDFLHAPMGYMMPLVCPLEIKNVGGIKLRYNVLEEEIKKYNMMNDDFPVFKLENVEGSLSPGETSYIIASFRPLTIKHYSVRIPILYTDNQSNNHQEDFIVLSGYGYNPRVAQVPEVKSKYENMPKTMVYNNFEGNLVQKCGLSLEELDFGLMDSSKTSSQIFILYNYSMNDQFNYEFFIPGFNLTDELIFEPAKGKLEPNSHVVIKAKLTASSSLSSYCGEIECIVSWLVQGDSKNISSKENLYIRVNKKAKLKELPGKIEQSINPNISFLEEAIIDCIKEILCDEEFDNLLTSRLDNSPLGLYEWTTNTNYPNQQEVRAKIISNYLSKANTNQLEINNLSITNSKRNHLNTRGNTSSQQSEKSKDEAKRNSDVSFENVFTDNEDIKIEDKYMQEIIGKNCYSNIEVNEKMIVVNSDSRDLINMILESTFNNIIAEAIFGETDLTEQTKIFFYKK